MKGSDEIETLPEGLYMAWYIFDFQFWRLPIEAFSATDEMLKWAQDGHLMIWVAMKASDGRTYRATQFVALVGP